MQENKPQPLWSAAEKAREIYEIDTLGHPARNRKDRRKMMKAAGAFKKKRRSNVRVDHQR